jgi:MinD superfamily P-loop ATPase
MKELVIISGKGGTGKTSIVACFAALARKAVLADCDVDAADLHLVLAPETKETEEFRSGHKASIRSDQCNACGVCYAYCRFDAILKNSDSYTVDPIACEGCGVCVHFCPVQAIDFEQPLSGHCFQSETRFGPMVHARLGIAEENSGKLVSLVRQRARDIAEARNLDTVIIDGSPGIGCPVIASITGAALVVVVTEPTLSGRHDLERVLELALHFKTPAMVIINKADLNQDMAEAIIEMCHGRGVTYAGSIPYDPAVTQAQLAKISTVEYDQQGPAAKAIKEVWGEVMTTLDQSDLKEVRANTKEQ